MHLKCIYYYDDDDDDDANADADDDLIPMAKSFLTSFWGGKGRDG